MGFTTGAGPCTLRAMQDRFVGDIGDFGKYGLLRALTGLWPPLPPKDRLSLGVVWYVPDKQTIAQTPDDHGQNISYLFNENVDSRFQKCDPSLFNAMKNIVYSARNLQGVELSHILGSYTVFYDTPLEPRNRERWIDSAFCHTNNSEIIFLDPDIGMADPQKGKAPKTASYQSREATKYVFLSEIATFVQGRTVVIYQSFGRSNSHDQLENWDILLRNAFPQVSPSILKFNSRAFIILPAAKHATLIDQRLRKMLDGPWQHHFTPHRAKG